MTGFFQSLFHSLLSPEDLDFDAAIAAHVIWKDRLTCYLQSSDRTLDPIEVAKDCKCDLGRWIYGKGMVLAPWPEYRDLKTHHARFHLAAASVVARANAGHAMTIETALDADSHYARASASVIAAILAMKHKTSP